MKGISKSKHKQLQGLAIDLEDALELEISIYAKNCNHLVVPLSKELNYIRGKRIGMHEQFRAYLNLLNELDKQIAAYENGMCQIRFELKKHKRSIMKRQQNVGIQSPQVLLPDHS